MTQLVKDPKNAVLLFWVHTDQDTRDTASALGSFEVPRRWAVRLARAMEYDYLAFESSHTLRRLRDQFEEAARRASSRPCMFSRGHGITVVYYSGRKTTVRLES